MQVNKNTMKQFLTVQDTCFTIPVYQRNYDWNKENSKHRFSDILFVAQSGGTKTHFLGTICSKTIYSREKSIIDGQQRITSLSLLLKAMHDCVCDEDFKRGIEQTYLKNTGYGVDPRHAIKLRLNRRDDQIYRQLLASDGFVPAEQLTPAQAASSIYQNYLFFFESLKDKTDAERLRIRDALERIIIVDLDVEGENPQEIFESLNSTGLDLSPVDLLRNYLLMSLDYETQLRYYEDYWFKIEENVRPENMVRFFVDYLIFTKKSDSFTWQGRRAHINKAKLYEAFKDHYRALGGEEERYTSSAQVTGVLLEDMLKCSKLYAHLVFGPKTSYKNLPRASQLIFATCNLIEAEGSRPVLLYILKHRQAGNISEACALELLQACNSLAMRARVCGASGINGQFAGVVLQRLPENPTDGVASVFWQALTSGSGKYAFPLNDTFQECLLNRSLYETLRAKGTKQLLYTLELHAANAKGLPDYDDVNTSVEHIVPQTLTPEWEAALGTGVEQHAANLNKLGNLALTSNNSEMSNSSFASKADWYKQSSFTHTRSLAAEAGFNIASIQERGAALAEECLRVWPMPASLQESGRKAEATQRRAPFRFSMIGLIKGDEIAFVNDTSQVAFVDDDRYVMYEGERYSLTSLALKLLGRSGAVQGPLYFSYEGQILHDLRIQAESGVF